MVAVRSSRSERATAESPRLLCRSVRGAPSPYRRIVHRHPPSPQAGGPTRLTRSRRKGLRSTQHGCSRAYCAMPDSSRVVALGGGALVAGSLAGGAISVAAGVNSWSTAWTSEATLAAPWPMLLVQAADTVAATQSRRRPPAIGSVVVMISGSRVCVGSRRTDEERGLNHQTAWSGR
jgi:hypothetical protein